MVFFGNSCGDDLLYSVCMAFCLYKDVEREVYAWFSGGKGSDWGWIGVAVAQGAVLLLLGSSF